MANTFILPLIGNNLKVPDSSIGVTLQNTIGLHESHVATNRITYNADFRSNVSDLAIVNSTGSGKVVKIHNIGLAEIMETLSPMGVANPLRWYFCTGFTGGNLVSNAFQKLDSSAPDLPSGIDIYLNITSLTGSTQIARNHGQVIHSCNRTITTTWVRPGVLGKKSSTNIISNSVSGDTTPRILNQDQGISLSALTTTSARSIGCNLVSIMVNVNGYTYLANCYTNPINHFEAEWMIFNSSTDAVSILRLDFSPVYLTNKNGTGTPNLQPSWPRWMHDIYRYSNPLSVDTSKEVTPVSFDSTVSLPSGIKAYTNCVGFFPNPPGDTGVELGNLLALRGARKSQIPSTLISVAALEAFTGQCHRRNIDYTKQPLVVNPGEVFVSSVLHTSASGVSIANGDNNEEGFILFTVEDQPVAPTTSAEYGSSY